MSREGVLASHDVAPAKAGAMWSDLVKAGRAILGALDAELGLLEEDDGVRFDALGEPDVRADDGLMANDRVAAEDRGVGVDDDLVFECRVALHAADDVARGVARKAESTERHTLVKLHIAADV